MGLLGAVQSDPKKGQESSIQPQFVESIVYGSKYALEDLPQFEMNEEPIPGETAYRLISDELELDGTPALNLASFVSTWMDPYAEKLMVDGMKTNFIDYEEYPSTVTIHNRAVNLIGKLFNAPVDHPEGDVLGVSTVGSSEAIILGVLAMKKRWQAKMRKAGKSTERPNLIMNSAVQVCWEKATRYLDIEEKWVNCTKDRHVIDPQAAIDLIDENTIGICSILGTTYTGEYEDTKALNDLLEKKYKDTNGEVDVYIHVDAASGGFVAPFVNPDLEWDFRLPRVASINTSGHKYGLVYPGVGWAFWRSKAFLPEELVFHIAYLGADQASFTLNFSKSASQVLAQYYVLIRNGKAGFRAIMQSITNTADHLAAQLEKGGRFKILSQGGGKGLPLVAFRLIAEDKHYDEFAIAAKLKERGWIIPAYNLPKDATDVKILRVVCRGDFSRSRCDTLLRDLESTCEYLDSLDKKTVDQLVSHNIKERKHKSNKKGLVQHKTEEAVKAAADGVESKTHAVC